MIGRHTRRVGLALATVTVLLVTACGSSGSEPVRDPSPVEDPLPEVDTSGMWLPTHFEDLRVVDPGWDTAPQFADGVYLAAGERDGVLAFTAVDVHGTVLWSAQRPASCTGFVVTTDAQGRALAVLGDVQATDDALAATTATAYDLATGEHVWGPVEVAGPHQGPGLVFAAPPEGVMGDTGPRTALDPTTGRVAATESGSDEVRLIGEYHGIVLLTEDDALVAHDIGNDRELWSIPLAEHGWTATSIEASPDAPTGDGLAVIATSDPASALIDLHEGSVLSETADDAALDPTTGTLVVLDDAGLHAYNSDDQALWSLAVTPETTVTALGRVFLYLRERGVVRVHNVITGDVAEAYEPHGRGSIVVPVHIAAEGSALLLDGDRRLLATVPEPSDVGGSGP